MSSATTQRSVKDAKKRLTAFLRTLETKPQEELERVAKEIYSEAIELTPYSSGKLESSVYVRVSKNKRKPGLVAGASARSPLGYNYAGIQHENERFNHPVKGRDHFISIPFNEGTERLAKRLGKELVIK